MNYYNEYDAKTAAWLKQLITDGLVPHGDVDTRSITEVTAGDLSGYTQCHFFAGIGGWSLALQLAGWPRGRPVWTGSCPCQPFSSAGKQKGAEDERHLWPAFFNLIRQCRPEHVFGEQVASAIGHGWLDGVSSDLGEEGYACGSAVLGAHSVGAPHIRQRLYWVAYTNDTRSQGRGCSELPECANERIVGTGSNIVGLGDTNGERHDGQHPLLQRNESRRNEEDLLEASWPCEAGWSRYDLIPCRDGKQRRIESGTFPLVNGLPKGMVYSSDPSEPINPQETAEARIMRLRGYGNAIVPQVASAFIQAFLESNESTQPIL